MGWFYGGLGLTWQVYVIKTLLNSFFQVFILSQKHILGVKKVVWCGLDVVWGGLEVVWGVLGWFGVFPRTAPKLPGCSELINRMPEWAVIKKRSFLSLSHLIWSLVFLLVPNP